MTETWPYFGLFPSSYGHTCDHELRLLLHDSNNGQISAFKYKGTTRNVR